VNRTLSLTSYGRRDPLWPWVLVATCMICLMMQLAYVLLGPANQEAWLHFWGFSPQRVMALLEQPPRTWLDPDLLGVVTALFVHVDWLHLIGNLAYLWVFGVTVERAVDHLRLALLFLVFGGVANLSVGWQLADTSTLVIGASGGVSAIIGVYLGLFPGRRMGLWIPLGLYLQFVRVPALLVIGSWFTLQLLYSVFGPMSSTVAWWSHIVGFLLGLFAALLLRLFSRKVNFALRED
jgi:membrane associated rhomboid family serine protease